MLLGCNGLILVVFYYFTHTNAGEQANNSSVIAESYLGLSFNILGILAASCSGAFHCFRLFFLFRMGLAISLVSDVKEKVIIPGY